MDNFTMKEVENLISSGLLSSTVLHSIFESTTRKIEMYNDLESINILKYLGSQDSIPLEVRSEISDFLTNYDKYNLIFMDSDEDNSSASLFFIIIGVILILLGIVLFFLNS